MPHLEQKHRPVLALGLIALVMVTAACSSPETKATPRPAPTHAVVTTQPPGVSPGFVSQRYGFRLTLGTGWSASDAQIAWDGKDLQGLQSPAFADFTEPATGRAFTVGAAPVATGMQLAGWRAAVVQAAPPGCVDAKSTTNVTLGGEPALAWTTDGDVQPRKIAAVHGNRGYIAIFELSPASETAADLRLLESIRQSFHFTS